ncbi:hypothetical protein PATSB16_20090 [Pandoraea thiooxydans]|nr:hypothetical protein PATSB16_20090 [Pandoraea thiooxydans]
MFAIRFRTAMMFLENHAGKLSGGSRSPYQKDKFFFIIP